MKLAKFWFGTEFESKSPEEKRALLSDDEDEESGWDDDSVDDYDAELSFEQSPPPVAAAQTDENQREGPHFRKYSNEELRAMGIPTPEEEALISDPHTSLDLAPIKRLATAPVSVLRGLLQRSARGVVLNAVKKKGAGWKTGEDPLKATSKGTEPARSTQKVRAWKNEAAKEGAVDKWGPENVERMKRGLAPQRENLKTGEVESREFHHHPIPWRHGGREVIDVWPEEHAAMDPYRRLKKR